MEKYLNILELPKITAKIQEYARLESTKSYLEKMILMTDLDEIEQALQETDEAVIIIQRMQRFPLYFESDIGFLLSGTKKGRVLSEADLLEIGKFFDTIRANQVFLETLSSHQIEVNSYPIYVNKLFYPKALNLRIKEIITPYGEIKDEASFALKEIRKSIRDTERNIQNKLQEVLSKNASKLTQALISIRNDRYVIPVKTDLKNSIQGIVHDQSASKETTFIEPQAVFELNNRLNHLKEEEKQEIYNILREVSVNTAEYYEELKDSLQILEHLDLVFSKAEYAISIDAKKPKLNNDGILDLINCRHPLLAIDTVVPNTVTIGKDYQGIIITGPNTGGKTVLLKTIGLLSVMVKMGLLVPCDENSDIMIFDNVFADIGDEQSIDQNLSTFSSHLKNVINIMHHVTDHSLVVLDELGSGTDPAEGSSLAIAIFDYLIAKHCLVIATSHYSELKIHAFNTDSIINASVEFDIKTLKPTYKLLLGVPGQSNAIKISKMLGLPEAIIKKAEDYAYQKDDKINSVLEKLISQTHELDRKLQQAEAKQKDLQQKIQLADLEYQKALAEKNRILKTAEAEAMEKIRQASKTIDKIINELSDMKLREVKAHEIAEIKHEVKVLKEEAHVETESIQDTAELQVNESVYVENFGAYGIILKKSKNNKYDVQIGNATVSVDRKFLKAAESKTDIPVKKTVTLEVKKHVPMTLDLRGYRYEDALIELEKYIDDAVYAALNQVSIIHGFGTGVIRELVLNFLKSSELVESFRYGGANEGGQGITVVTLKSK